MNEIVKYDNVLNTLQFKDFTAMDYNVLMCLCHKMRDKGSKTLTFTYDELKQLTDFGKHSDKMFTEELRRTIKKLLKVDATHISGSKESYFVLFPTFEIDPKEKTLTVSVNKKFAYILNELTDNFTRFELKEYAELDSKYTKTLYRILKQYKKSGWWKPTVEELRIVLDVPEKYSNKRILGDILNPSLKVLEEKFVDLKCEPIKAQKRGAPIERYYFTWQAENQIKGQKHIADYYGVMPGEKTTKKPFNSFEQNETNYNELEDILLDN